MEMADSDRERVGLVVRRGLEVTYEDTDHGGHLLLVGAPAPGNRQLHLGLVLGDVKPRMHQGEDRRAPACRASARSARSSGGNRLDRAFCGAMLHDRSEGVVERREALVEGLPPAGDDARGDPHQLRPPLLHTA